MSSLHYQPISYYHRPYIIRTATVVQLLQLSVDHLHQVYRKRQFAPLRVPALSTSHRRSSAKENAALQVAFKLIFQDMPRHLLTHLLRPT